MCGQPIWDTNDYQRDFTWLGQPREDHMEKPSVGRMVHYVAYGTPGGEFPSGVCRAAIITEVESPDTSGVAGAEETVALFVANPSGVFFNHQVPHDEQGKRAGTWHWPERV